MRLVMGRVKATVTLQSVTKRSSGSFIRNSASNATLVDINSCQTMTASDIGVVVHILACKLASLAGATGTLITGRVDGPDPAGPTACLPHPRLP